MKRLTTLLALALGLALTAGVAQAAKAKPAKNAEKHVNGTVLKVDGMNIVVQTRGKNAGEVTVTTDANTKFQIDGKEGTLSDVKAGERISVTPAEGTAQKVNIRTKANKPRKPKAPKPAQNI